MTRCLYRNDSQFSLLMVELEKRILCTRCYAWLACWNILVGYWCGVVWSFPSPVYFPSCVKIGILFSLLFPSIYMFIMWNCYISFTIVGCFGWFIFWSTLRTITAATLRVGCSLGTLRRNTWLKFVFSCSIDSNFDVPIFVNEVGNVEFFSADVSSNDELSVLYMLKVKMELVLL